MTRKRTFLEELGKLDDEIDESILSATSEVLREELVAQGVDPEAVVSEMDAVTARAKSMAAKRTLQRAKEAVLVLKSNPAKVTSVERDAVRKKLDAMRSGDGTKVSDMMIAARKGEGLSENDEQGILDDLARLAALEAEDREDE